MKNYKKNMYLSFVEIWTLFSLTTTLCYYRTHLLTLTEEMKEKSDCMHNWIFFRTRNISTLTVLFFYIFNSNLPVPLFTVKCKKNINTISINARTMWIKNGNNFFPAGRNFVHRNGRLDPSIIINQRVHLRHRADSFLLLLSTLLSVDFDSPSL